MLLWMVSYHKNRKVTNIQSLGEQKQEDLWSLLDKSVRLAKPVSSRFSERLSLKK